MKAAVQRAKLVRPVPNLRILPGFERKGTLDLTDPKERGAVQGGQHQRLHLNVTSFPWNLGIRGPSSIQRMSILPLFRLSKRFTILACWSGDISPIPMSSPDAPLEMGTGTAK